MSKMTVMKEDKYSEWRVDDALRTLTRAIAIKRDKKMMRLVQALAKKKMAEMASVTKQKV